MKLLNKKDLLLIAFIFLFTAASLGFSTFLMTFDETTMESTSQELLAGNLGAIIALTYSKLLFAPSVLIAIGIDKIFPKINHMHLVPIIGGLIASAIYVLILFCVEKLQTKKSS